MAYCLWQRFLRFDPQDPIWPNRNRFVLSIGHASMLLYSLLHLTDVKAVSKDYERLGEPSVPLDAIKHFRQWGSKCPGHPEYRWTSGVETTTGPLGQGIANSVGMALAGRWPATHYNRPGFEDMRMGTGGIDRHWVELPKVAKLKPARYVIAGQSPVYPCHSAA